MKTISVKQPMNLKVVRFELNFAALGSTPASAEKKPKDIKVPREIKVNIKKQRNIPSPPVIQETRKEKRDVKDLIEELLEELYADQRDWSSNSGIDYCRGSTSAASITSSLSNYCEQTDAIERSYLEALDVQELRQQKLQCEERLQVAGERLARCVRARDRLRRQQKRLCAAFTVLLRHITGESGARFGVAPGEGPGEGGYAEWLHAMRLVARLPAGVPQHFRKKLWLNLAERHLNARGIDWPAAERACFRGTAMPDDEELGAQILKDLHRTGCSLFCGTEGRENQAMLRRVLLAYARWNKDVGYCQGFNMLAAIILEVMEKSESDSLKVMIYLVEAVLPEGYFADDLRGLSADMAAFRDLLRLRLPRLANHMDHLQRISDEPPLPDVFTMQWFLTLYATWLPRESLLRIWDLILLDGNEVLLLTALAIWDMLQDRILSARSADEFYSCMGGGVGAVWEAGETLVARVVAFGSAPELPRLRSLHRYRVAPPAPPAAPPVCQPPLHSTMQSMTKRGLRLFYSEDEGDSSDDGNKLALATIIPRREDRSGTGDRLSLDIGALKRQYARLRERQRQAHVILAAACARHAAVGVSTSPTSLTVNNLLLGKSAIVSSRGRRLGPPPGAIPPSRHTTPTSRDKTEHRSHGKTSDTISWKEEKNRKSLSRRNSVKWKDIKNDKVEKCRKTSIDLDEAGDGVIVSELEANQMIASLRRSRSSSETSSYSSHSASSTDTSLCDENERGTDSEQELDDDKDKVLSSKESKPIIPPISKELKKVHSPVIIEPPKPPSPDLLTNKIATESSVQDISEYLDTAAGEPLRTYIDGFETKLKDVLNVSGTTDSYNPISPFKNISPFSSPRITTETEVIQRLSRTRYEDGSKSSDSIRPTSLPSTKAITDLSPLNLSPCTYNLCQKSPYDLSFTSNFKQPSPSKADLILRPPDIIDSLTMYPNFVPDIDLSEKNVSDIDSPPQSPGAESIIVSEDEPPIPLKIDKYFEHSPEFFGARVTDPNSSNIPNRRATKRNSRIPKKPDSLTLQSSYNEKIMKDETERASSLPQSHSFTKSISSSPINLERDDFHTSIIRSDQNDQSKIKESPKVMKQQTPDKVKDYSEIISPKDYILRSGRKNSERALQIIQENSKILSRILTKQNITEVPAVSETVKDIKKTESFSDTRRSIISDSTPEKPIAARLMDSPLLKESTSDSLIGYRKRNSSVTDESSDKNDFVRVRPISIDDPFSLEVRSNTTKDDEFNVKNTKTPSIECLGNKTDLYGWENKGFLAKYDFKSNVSEKPSSTEFNYKRKTCDFSTQDIGASTNEFKLIAPSDWTRHSFSGESKTSVTLPSTEPKDTNSYDRKYTSDDYNYPFSSKYNDYVLSKASDICSKTVDQGPKICENLSKTDNSQVSDFAHVVTSSISFTYEPSAEDDSPIGAKSNSSDTLCQITSLDQVSTPISPKIFFKETPTLPKEYTDKSEKTILESDDTCSAITSLIETDTLSSLSYPRSPSTGSYHPFPTRPLRMPKELGVRLGMYPKDAISSPPK
ncbi:uncharacterized protein LOC126366994 isoform X2 [Pectinophora gossypiella]|uniref:uncharacterized protein LOC126366994 isoform X2 n=1 Tax=Pectinophora gossypiella TaxID=13191 RepID=UPI00214E3772|nr:uncharacterized protein LOC126366994 isoform X2 [Pectinophora gossypiella]